MRRVIYIMGFPEYLTNLSLSKIGYLMAVTGWKYLIHNQHFYHFLSLSDQTIHIKFNSMQTLQYLRLFNDTS